MGMRNALYSAKTSLEDIKEWLENDGFIDGVHYDAASVVAQIEAELLISMIALEDRKDLPETVSIAVEGGVVVDVTGLPDGYDYVVNDRDNQEG